VKKAAVTTIALLALLALSACGGPSDVGVGGTTTTGPKKAKPTTTTSTATAAGPVTVVLKNLVFTPKDVKIKVGAEVVWKWDDGPIPHTVTAEDGSFDSGDASQTKGTFRYTFTKPGKVPYKCIIHPTMTGTVTVG
jgi:plastocyanin